MDVYFRASNGTYLAVDRTQDPIIAANSLQANFNSLISINVYDPTSRSRSLSLDEAPLFNGNMVTLHSSDGSMLAPDPYGMLHPNGAKSGQMGYNIFRVYKLGGSMEDPICPGDLIALRLLPSTEKAASPWMSIDCDGAIANFCSGHQQPTDTEQFQILAPVDLRDFLIEYDDLYNEVVAHIALTGPALPGGHAVRLESPDGGEFFPTTDIVVGDKPWFVIPMTQAAQQLTPANRRKIAVRAVFQTTGTCVEQPFIVEGDRALFMQMEVQKITKVPPKSPDQKTRSFDVDVQLYLASDRRVKAEAMPLNVVLHAGPDGIVQHLSQAWHRLTYEHPIPFRFTIDQPPTDCEEPIRTTISAQYSLNGIERCSRFEVRISRKGILIDPH